MPTARRFIASTAFGLTTDLAQVKSDFEPLANWEFAENSGFGGKASLSLRRSERCRNISLSRWAANRVDCEVLGRVDNRQPGMERGFTTEPLFTRAIEVDLDDGPKDPGEALG